jgi:Magnesium chelatase, subunit ChlI
MLPRRRGLPVSFRGKGQPHAKQALEIVAAGGHNTLFVALFT